MLRNSDDVIAVLTELSTSENIPVDKLVIGGDAAMILMCLREEANTFKVWLEPEEFNRLANSKGVTNHPMTDTVVNISFPLLNKRETLGVEVRERNFYFPDRVIGRFWISAGNESAPTEVKVFDTLSLLIQKRAEYSEAVATSKPRELVAAIQCDLHALNAILAEKNKVKDVA